MSMAAHCCRLLALWWTLAGPALVRAQDSVVATVKPVPVAVKAGKWVLLGAALGMGALAISAHHKADDAYSELEAYCAPDRSRCDLGTGGSYIDPSAERLYQESLSYDRKARGWFIGGEVALVGAAVMFIWEFSRPHGRPDNIPFEPELRIGPSGTRLGVSVPF